MLLNDISKSINFTLFVTGFFEELYQTVTNLHWYNHRIPHYIKSKAQVEGKTVVIENNPNPSGLLLEGIAKQTSCYKIP